MIEDSLKRAADALERIAAALERSSTTAKPAVAEQPTPAATPAPAGKKKAAAAAPAPVVTPPASSFLDDDDEDEPAGPPLTKEDVKKALVAAQERLAKKLGDAQKGMVEAMKILAANGGGAETLKALGEDQAVYRAIVKAAEAAGK